MRLTTRLLFPGLLLAAGIAVADIECTGGGEGGIPALQDVSGSIIASQQSHLPLGGVQDMVVLENREVLVYRNAESALYAIDYSAGGGPSQLLTRRSPPLTRLTDRGETQLLARDSFDLFSLKTFTWKHLVQPLVSVDHLFWNRKFKEELFSLERPTGRGRREFTLHHWWAGDERVSSCVIRPPGDYEWRVVEGSTWPYVALYREVHEKKRRRILFRTYRRDCRWFGRPEIRIRGTEHPPLQSIYQYGETGQMVIKFDDPNGKNVYVTRGLRGMGGRDESDEPGSCVGYALENSPPVYLSAREPVLATRVGQSKLSLVYLKHKKYARLELTLPQPGLDPTSIALTNDASRLWVTVVGDGGEAEIRQIDLDLDALGR